MVRDIGEFPLINMANVMLTILRMAAERPDSPADCLERLLRILTLAHEDAGAQRLVLNDRIRLAITELSATALLEEVSKGKFRLTGRGRIVLEEHPMGVDETILAQFREFWEHAKQDDTASSQGEAVSIGTPCAQAYLDGHGAYMAGRPVTDNPHPADIAEHIAWDSGWFEALDETIENAGS